MPGLPESTVTLKEGRVSEIKNWVLNNGVPSLHLLISKGKDGFYSKIGGSEHGGTARQSKNLTEVLLGMDDRLKEMCTRLFELEFATTEKVWEITRPVGHFLVVIE